MEVIRTDKWLKQQFPSLTSRQIEEALEGGLVYLGRNPFRKKGARLSASETLDCSRLIAHLEKLKQGNGALQIPVIHEEEAFFVVDKPAGTPSQPLGLFEENTVTHWALAKCPGIQNEFSDIQPTVTPHRLDIGTSGLQIVCKTKAAFISFRSKFEAHSIEKSYLAWCFGSPKENDFEIETILCASKDPSQMRIWSFECEEKPFTAFSTVQVLKRNTDLGISLLKVTTQSGVRHQIRVQLSHLGFPLVGDATYDPFYDTRTLKPSHHLLRASKLSWDNKSFELTNEYECP